MSNGSESLPRFNPEARFPEDASQTAREGPVLFNEVGSLGSLTIFPTVAFVGSGKSTVEIDLRRLAGVIFQRSLQVPWFGLYRLTLFYLGPDPGTKRTASSVMSYDRVMKAIGILSELSAQHGAELVIRKQPYPFTQVLACAAVFPVGVGFVAARSGQILGGLVLGILLFIAILFVELVVELPHRQSRSSPGVRR